MYYDFTQEKRKKHVFHYYLSHCKSSDRGEKYDTQRKKDKDNKHKI